MNGARLSKDQLKSRLGFSERLAIRIGALQSRGLECTLVVLEEAGSRRELQDLLLTPQLLDQASELTTDAIRTLSPAASDLVVVPGEGRIIALEEETLAEQAWKRENALPAVSESKLPALDKAAQVLGKEEAKTLFQPEEVSRLKLTLLTGVEPKEKIEALRRLKYTPLPEEEKGILTLRCLADPDPDVRREAASALHALGLNRDLADALSGVASGTPRQRILALERVESISSRLGDAERRVAVSSLVSGLRHEKDATVLQGMASALGAYADLVRANPEWLSLLTRHLARVLIEHYDTVSGPVRALYDQLAQKADPASAKAVWKEIESIGDRRLRFFFLAQICEMNPEGELREQIARTLARNFVEPGVEDMEYRNAIGGSKRLGDVMVGALIDEMDATKDDQRSLLVKILDGVSSSENSGKDARNRAARKLLQLLKTGDRSLRATILEARTWFDESVEKKTRRQFAEEMITSLHTYKAPRFHDLTRSALRRLRLAALDPLRESVTASPYAAEREAAAELLGELAAENIRTKKDHKELVLFLRSLEGGDKVSHGVVVRSVARALQTPKADAGLVREILSDYRKRVGMTSTGFDILVAVANIAASPVCDTGVAADTALQVVDLLGQKFPDPQMAESHTNEGTLLVVGSTTTVYTDLIPDLMTGLLRIVEGGRIPHRMLETMIDKLLERFKSVTEYQEIWAPGNIVMLAETLEAILRRPKIKVAHRLKVLDGMQPAVRNLSLARVASRLYDLAEEKSAEYDRRVHSFVAEMFRMLELPSYQEMQDRLLILEALGRTCVNRSIDPSPEKSTALKERIVELLIEHRGFESRDGRELKETLRGAKGLPAKMRERLKAPRGKKKP